MRSCDIIFKKEEVMSNKRLNKNDAPKNILDKEKILGEDDFIVSKTDTKGKITYFNRIFQQMAGYDKAELNGANHNLIRHPDMPKIAFKVAWDLIQNGKEFYGFVKNLCKDGGYYWVFAYITPDYDDKGKITGYTSVRIKPKRSAIAAVTPLYAALLKEEKSGGMEASSRALQKFLTEQKISYEALVIALQNGGE
jgi:PAS domain S-box-containing protein